MLDYLKIFAQHLFPNAIILVVTFSLLSACQKHIQHNDTLWDSYTTSTQRRRLVSDAYQLKHRKNYHFSDAKFSYDCSGYISSALHKNGLLTQAFAHEQNIQGNGVSILFQFIEKSGQIFKRNHIPKPGDIVFFSNTYDRNKDRQLNDLLTHIAIVESVNSDGQVVFLHHMNGKVRKGYLNMGFEDRHKKSTQLLNSYLRRKRSSDAKNTKYLAAQMVHAYGSLIVK